MCERLFEDRAAITLPSEESDLFIEVSSFICLAVLSWDFT
jgi:hypothetical protein